MSMKDVMRQMTAALKEAQQVTGKKLKINDLHQVSPDALPTDAGWTSVHLPATGLFVQIKSSKLGL